MITAAGLLAAALMLPACGHKEKTGETYALLRAKFASPAAEYRTSPLWVWNDRMTEGRIREQLADFKARGIGGVFVHPRPGLITPYLSDEWFSLFRTAVETGKELGLKVWIYDENSYPSGFAGGHVPAAMPEAVRSGMHPVRVEGRLGPRPGQVAAVFRNIPTGYQDVTAKYNHGDYDELGPGSYTVIEVVKSSPAPWNGGYTYVDLMKKGVTDKFIELTYGGYKRVAGREFGVTVPGAFQDEAEIGPPGGPDMANYSSDLFAAFQRQWGYDLRPQLMALFEPYGEWRRVRFDYYSTLLDLFIENWAKTYYTFCTDNNLQLTGHYWEHEWPNPQVSPDTLAMAAYAHIPGIDMLMDQWGTGPHAQFGNARSVREIRSAANQFGRSRTLSETYGASGWDLSFASQKRIGDWEYALGVNFLDQHLSYVTIKGARKRDHPLSFSYHEPWWPLYNTLADYFGRLSAVLSSGRQPNRILVIEPTTTAWMEYSPSGKNEKVNETAEDFQKFVNLLEANHIEYDLASEKTIEEFGTAKYRRLAVGRALYDLVVLPPGMENMDDSTLALLKEYLLHHGRILSWVAPPPYVNGIITNDVRQVQRSYGDRWLDSGTSGFNKLRDFQKAEVSFEEPVTNPWLFHQRRIFDDGQMLFLANSGKEERAAGKVSLEGSTVERWDPFTGAVEPYPFERKGGRVVVRYDIPPEGSLLLVLKDSDRSFRPAAALKPAAVPKPVAPAGILTVKRVADNVLTLDFCDLVMGKRTDRDLYFYEAQKRTFQHYGFDKDPWDSAVQYKTAIIDRDRFPADSGFEAVFHFMAVKTDAFDLASLKVVVERPGLFKVAVNDREVKPLPNEWWLDKDFGVYPIGKFVRSGANKISVKARPFSVYAELEPVYLLGDFSAVAAAKGFIIRPAAALRQGPWDEQGLTFYGNAVSYEADFDLSAMAAGSACRLKLGDWNGVAAEVTVNGGKAGLIAWPPYELDVTRFIKPGSNRVSVAVYGSLRNTLGPFHGDPPSGAAWPASFQKAPTGGQPAGRDYKVVKYGLFRGMQLLVAPAE